MNLNAFRTATEIKQLLDDADPKARGGQLFADGVVDIDIEPGPCSECEYTWQGHPKPQTAICPRCADYGVGADNSDTPHVEVPNSKA